MGFGHRVYKNYDPRAKIIKQVADEVFEVTGRNPLLDIALELERIALEDEYFVSTKLYPNVDFYSGIIYQAMGFPVEMFPVLFAIGRMPGLAGPVGGGPARPRAEDRPAAPDLRRPGRTPRRGGLGIEGAGPPMARLGQGEGTRTPDAPAGRRRGRPWRTLKPSGVGGQACSPSSRLSRHTSQSSCSGGTTVQPPPWTPSSRATALAPRASTA